MSTTSLPERPALHCLTDVLRPNWDPTDVRGYDITVDTLTDAAYLADGTSLDSVGEQYPSLVVTDSQPGSTGSTTTYDFTTTDGPGQNRTLTLLATIRAEERDTDTYTGDSGTYSGTDAQTIVEEIATHVEDICFDVAAGGSSEFTFVGCQRPSTIPDDNDPDEGRVVRQAQVEIRAGNIRAPQ